MIIDIYRVGNKIVFFILLMFFVILQSSIFAQSGTIKGRVYDKESKTALVGANVIIKGTSLGAAADLDGNYIIREIPAGRHTFIISYIGYYSDTVSINITAGATLERNFYLSATAIEGKTITVTAQAQGQISAIQQQLSSNKIVNVVSEAKIQELPDFNAAQALSRLPGVSTLESSGEANKVVIRGLAPQYNLIAIGGVSLPATGSTQIGAASQGGTAGVISSDRSVDLSMITPYMIKSIEVYKALTPDLNGDALGGYVNMQLREAPSGLHGDALWQSGYTEKSGTYGNYRFVASASDRFFNDMLGVYVLGNAESYDRNADNMNASYIVTNSQNVGANGYLPVQVNTVTLDRHIETRKRYGGNLILDYRLPSGSLKLVNMFSRLKSNFQDYQTGYNYQNGNLNFTYQQGDNTVDVALNSLNFTNDFGFMSVDFTAANNYSRNSLPREPQIQFQQTRGVNSAVNNVTPDNLTYLIRYGGVNSTYLQNISLFSTDYKENDQTYKGDFKIPFNFSSDVSGFFKTGGEYRYNLHNNAQNTPYATVKGGSPITNLMINGIRNNFPGLAYDSSQSQFTAASFTNTDNSLYDSFLGDRFGRMLWVAQPGLLNDVVNYISSVPSFNAINSSGTNAGGWTDGPFQQLANTYKYIEKYYAGYLMAQFNVGKLMVVGGARFEQEKSLFQAYNLRDGRNPSTDTAFMVTAYPQNHFWLPMVQAKFDLADWVDVRYAYTQTLARPAYSQLSPHFNMDYTSSNVWGGNPNLVPAHSYNHDLIFTFHNNDIGLLSIDGFYKTIKDFTFSTQYALYATAPPGLLTYNDLNIGGKTPNPKAMFYTYVNSPYLAYVKGIEFDLQTRLWYLPGALNGIILGLNYTKIHSQATYPWRDSRSYLIPPRTIVTEVLDSTRSGRLVNQPNDILNAYVGYDYKGFSARVSFLFQGNSVSYVGAFAEQDGFTRDYFRIDFSARQELPWPGLEIYVDANNLNSENNSSAQLSIGGFTNEQNYGLTADIGIRYRL